MSTFFFLSLKTSYLVHTNKNWLWLFLIRLRSKWNTRITIDRLGIAVKKLNRSWSHFKNPISFPPAAPSLSRGRVFGTCRPCVDFILSRYSIRWRRNKFTQLAIKLFAVCHRLLLICFFFFAIFLYHFHGKEPWLFSYFIVISLFLRTHLMEN